MIGWDALMMSMQVLALVGALKTVLDAQAYIPRLSSSTLTVAMIGITAALLGLGAPLGALITGLAIVAWAFIFIYRGTPPGQIDLWEADDHG